MSTSAHVSVRRRSCLAAAAAIAALITSAPAHASYGWPLKPFNEQHPVRGNFGDPRIAGHDEAHGSFHFGIDISAPNGTAVYATIDGTASIHPLHRDTVVVSGQDGLAHEYWHVLPSVRPGQRVTAFRTVVGHIEAPWAHVHFSEWHSGTYVNPLRRGALAPYRDATRPTVHHIFFERQGRAVGASAAGTVDLIAEAWDSTPLRIEAPWNDKPVTPALVRWRILGDRNLASSAWRVAADFRYALPRVPFTSVYGVWTRQNHAFKRGGSGRYRFLLAQGFDTASLPDGVYRVVVSVRDTAGNEARGERRLTVANV